MAINILNKIYQVIVELLALPFRILNNIIECATNIFLIIFYKEEEPIEGEENEIPEQVEIPHYPEIPKVEGFHPNNNNEEEKIEE